jgi:hypothetical protein
LISRRLIWINAEPTDIRDPTLAEIFPRWVNRTPLLFALASAVGAVATVSAIWYYFSPEYTDVGYSPIQPVPFSHRLHAGELGIDCRYCHNTVERSPKAAVPATETCMNCHRTIASKSEKLELVRSSETTDRPIPWVRVHMLPDYAYFDHSVHLAAGVGCVSCHGRIDTMETVRQEKSLSMGWCLDCHRDPAQNLRPVSMITAMSWSAVESGYEPTKDPDRKRWPTPPTHCSGCHR